MDVEDFVSLIDRQHSWLSDLADMDNAFMDLPPERWRKATRADKRRYDEFFAKVPYPNHIDCCLPSIHKKHVETKPFPPGYRFPPTRVWTAFRLFSFKDHVIDASQKAVTECQKQSELANVAPLVIQVTASHLDWLTWLEKGYSDEPDPPSRWINDYLEIMRQLRIHRLLCQDYEKAEWDRWRDLCTTIERRDILDRFWLAKTPLARSEIDPNAGTKLRRKIGEINKLAAMEKPAILWEIRADPTTQKWSKHWRGQ